MSRSSTAVGPVGPDGSSSKASKTCARRRRSREAMETLICLLGSGVRHIKLPVNGLRFLPDRPGSQLNGSVISVLCNMGISGTEANQYYAELSKGNVLLIVHTDNNEEVRLVEKIFRAEGVTQCTRSSEEFATP